MLLWKCTQLLQFMEYFQTLKALQCERWTLSMRHRSFCTVQNSHKPKYSRIDMYLKSFFCGFNILKCQALWWVIRNVKYFSILSNINLCGHGIWEYIKAINLFIQIKIIVISNAFIEMRFPFSGTLPTFPVELGAIRYIHI